jgi:hypothetical protein
MANIATNIFYANSMVEEDLTIVDEFLNKHFDSWVEHNDEESLDAEFSSRWDFPKDLMDELAELLTRPTEMYMRCLSHCLEDEYAALYVFRDGAWTLKD